MNEDDYSVIAGRAYYLKNDMEYVFFYNDEGVYYTHWKPYEKLTIQQFSTFVGKQGMKDGNLDLFLDSIKIGHDTTNFNGSACVRAGEKLFPDGYPCKSIVVGEEE